MIGLCRASKGILEKEVSSCKHVSKSTVEAEPLALADSLLEIFKNSPSSSNKPFAPSVDLDTCLQLLTSFSRIPFEALQRPIIRNGFLQCCNIAEQSGMSVSSLLKVQKACCWRKENSRRFPIGSQPRLMAQLQQ